MKNLILLIGLTFTISNIANGQYEKVFGSYMQFQKGDTLFAFNSCEIKSNPTIKSKTIAKINYGDIVIVDSIYSTYYDTFPKPKFYKVKVNSKSGYIEQSNISVCKMTLQSPTDFFLVNQLFLDTADVLNFKFISKGIEKTFCRQKLWGQLYSLKLIDNKGLEGLNNIICIDYYSEACGMEGGITYLSWDNYQIEELVSLSSVADGGVYYSDEKIIFPSDSGGKANKLIFQSEITEIIDEDSNWWKTTKEEREYNWVNKAVQPAFRSKSTEEY